MMNINVNDFIANYRNPLDRYIGHHDTYALIDDGEIIKTHYRYTDDELKQIKVLYNTGANRTRLAATWGMSVGNLHTTMKGKHVQEL